MSNNKIKRDIRKGAMQTVMTAALVMASSSFAFAQTDGLLRGRVIDNGGNPVAGAVVNVSESLKKTFTDNYGYFTLKKIKADDELFVTYLGYDQARVKPQFDNKLTVILTPADEYDDLVSVPFTKKPSKFSTESRSVVTGSELEKHPVTVLQNAFTSTVTGVETFETASEPGWSETAMYIRGIRTMNTNARAPLVIVDDVERDLSFLDAYPIENITILKDAAATAIYGMRGANGVILVTTKRGEAGKLKINFTQEVGFQTCAGIPDQQNSYNYALTMNQARYLDGLDPLYSTYDIEQYRKVCNGEQLTGIDRYKYFNTSWYDEVLRDMAPQYRTNLQLSGGTDRARYYVSFSYLRQEALYDSKWTTYNRDYSNQHVLNRYNLRVNVDLNVNKFLTIGLDLGGRIDNIVQPAMMPDTSWGQTWALFCPGMGENLPIYPVFCPNGEFFAPTSNNFKNGAYQIASGGIEQNRRRNLYTTVTATGNLDSLLPGLKARAVISFDSYETFQKYQKARLNTYQYNFQDNVASVDDFTYTRTNTYVALPNASTSPRDYYYNINTRFGLSYNQRFGKHLIDAQAFMRTYQNVVRGQNSSYRYLSWNAAATYVYNNRYILNGSISRMASDNYAPSNRWGTFPALSVGWVASEENFLKSNAISLLKLRASYGRSGQANTGTSRYPYQSTYAQGSGYNFGTTQSYVQGSYEATAGNLNNLWEISDMLNIGIDFDFFNKKLYGSVDVFKEWRSNILVDRSTIPTIFGIAAPQDSYGKAETRGIEFTIGHRNNIGKFRYYVEAMLTANKNKITEMDELDPDYEYQRKTGKRIGQQFMFILDKWAADPNLIPTSHQDAIDHPEKYPYSAAGTYKLGNAVFKDTNGDRIINTYDQVANGYSNSQIPELLPSLNVGFEYGGFDARVILTAYLNRTVECRENMDYGFGWGGTSTHAVTKTWGYYTDDPTDPRNVNAKYPRLSTTFSDVDRNYPYNTSDIWLVNGDFLSLRNIEVGYSLPKSILEKLSMTKCRFYFSGYNLCNWSHMPKGFDPEYPLNYIWSYPKTCSFSFGVNVEF